MILSLTFIVILTGLVIALFHLARLRRTNLRARLEVLKLVTSEIEEALELQAKCMPRRSKEAYIVESSSKHTSWVICFLIPALLDFNTNDIPMIEKIRAAQTTRE